MNLLALTIPQVISLFWWLLTKDMENSLLSEEIQCKKNNFNKSKEA